eukprot:TRINITY_DN16776_c0_g5_i1.p1 TRINITY_DN16776_c0_g5~~TRINITY_DN16776_c0_g5_i1.p1  ORF type:complete len:571 (-),score=127.00 TRINITY_DN16776_c0_g5_i1:64-1776(-)
MVRLRGCMGWPQSRSEPLLAEAESEDVAAISDAPGEELRRRARTDSDTARRIQCMIDQGTSVLNRGLGALRPARVEEHQRSRLCTPAAVVLVLAACISIPGSLYLEIYSFKKREEAFLRDESSQLDGMMRVAAIPLTCAAINFLIQHIRRTTFWWERDTPRNCYGFDPLSGSPMFLACLGLGRSAVQRVVNEHVSHRINFYLEIVIALVVLSMYFALLDAINGVMKGMVKEQEMINSTAPVKKMQNLVRNITRSNRPERDVVYCFAQTNTVPAEVLSYVWWLYYIFGKVLGAGICLALLMGVDKSILGHFLVGGMALSAATASGFMFELGPNTLSLFRLSLNKPFYVGDLVTLNSNGAMDAPATSIMGFVENITMMYVVIRNFEMKQTWIPHKVFAGLIIQNWTRRPSKTVLLNIAVSCRCPVKKVEKLVAFGKKWIQASEEIQQNNYQKCHITKTGNGYNIEVIFFPAIGVTHRGIRQKFLVAFMAAAERLQVPFVPLQIQQNFCDDNVTVPPFVPADVAEEFQDLLPDPNDRLPKGVGLGFRSFPGSNANLVVSDSRPSPQAQEQTVP